MAVRPGGKAKNTAIPASGASAKAKTKKQKQEPSKKDKTVKKEKENLERTEIATDGPLTGKVERFMRGAAFITPDEPIDHPSFKTGRACVFLGKSDVDGEYPTKGAEVTFSL